MYTTAKAPGPSLATTITNEASQIAGHIPELVELTESVPEGDAGTAPTAPSSLFNKCCSHLSNN